MLQSSNITVAGLLFGGVGGAIAASSVNYRRSIDYERTDIMKLRKNLKNINIRHGRLSKLVLKKGHSNRYILKMEYYSQGKNRRLIATVIPPADLVRQRKQLGLKREEIVGDYAIKTKMAFELAVPTEDANKMKWRL